MLPYFIKKISALKIPRRKIVQTFQIVTESETLFRSWRQTCILYVPIMTVLLIFTWTTGPNEVKERPKGTASIIRFLPSTIYSHSIRKSHSKCLWNIKTKYEIRCHKMSYNVITAILAYLSL